MSVLYIQKGFLSLDVNHSDGSHTHTHKDSDAAEHSWTLTTAADLQTHNLRHNRISCDRFYAQSWGPRWAAPAIQQGHADITKRLQLRARAAESHIGFKLHRKFAATVALCNPALVRHSANAALESPQRQQSPQSHPRLITAQMKVLNRDVTGFLFD